jgi:cell division protein FtsZ
MEEHLNFSLVRDEEAGQEDPCRIHVIKVVGVGGAGGNAVNNMIESGLGDVTYVSANTDKQVLVLNRAPVKIQLGAQLTRGLGAGNNPEMGKKAAEESMEEIQRVLEGSDMVFVTAGLGGGTGTGAAPVIAKAAKDLGALTVGVVTKPFGFEAKKRMRQAEEGLAALNEIADSVISIPNDRLSPLAPKNATMLDMFRKADEVLLHSVKGITDLIMKPGHPNVDYEDLRTTMSKAGMALMGNGSAKGENRAREAAEKALNHPLLEDISIAGAAGVLINFTARTDALYAEILEAVGFIQKEAGDEVELIWGMARNESLPEDELHITVIATGIGGVPVSMRRNRPGMQAVPAGRLRDVRPEDARRTVNLDVPAFLRRQNPEGCAEEDVRRGMILDSDDLDVPTFMRRKAD